MLDAEVGALLDVLNSGFPSSIHTMTAAEAQAVDRSRRRETDNIDDVKSADDVRIDTATGPVRVRVYQPHAVSGSILPVVVFFHGGGFVLCSIETHDGFCRRMSKALEAVVVSVDYRLAPGHIAPAAAEDAYAALLWTVSEHEELSIDPGRVIVAGDSAGGNLAAVVSIMARERGGPAIAQQVLIYPMLDPSTHRESYGEFGHGYYNTIEAMEWYWANYLGGDRLPDPVWLAAPMRDVDHRGLPPAIVVTAGADPLSSEGREYAGMLKAAGVPVLHRHYPGLFHGFLTMHPFGPGASARDLLWRDILSRSATIKKENA
ncbi:MAG: alpha/beta hydrolase [Actinomycetota bacterium]